jgi:hypothetical protein
MLFAVAADARHEAVMSLTDKAARVGLTPS